MTVSITVQGDTWGAVQAKLAGALSRVDAPQTHATALEALPMQELIDAIEGATKLKVVMVPAAKLEETKAWLRGEAKAAVEAGEPEVITAPAGEPGGLSGEVAPTPSTEHAELAEASGVNIPHADVPDSELDSQQKRVRTRAVNKAKKALEAAQEPAGKANGEEQHDGQQTALEPAQKPQSDPNEVEPAAPAQQTPDEIRATVTDLLHPLYAEGGEKEQAVRDLLAQFDVARFSDVPEPKLPELLTKARTLRGELTQSG